MKPEFRTSTPADSAAIRKLLCDVFAMPADHPTADERQVNWKYWQPREDWPGPRSFVLVKDGVLVAHGALVPGWCRWKEHRFSIAHLIDWAAVPASVGAGVTIMKQTAKLTGLHVVVGGSETTRKILPVFGYRPAGTATKYARAIRPLRRLLDEPRKTARLAAQFARSVVWTVGAPAVSTAGWVARRIRPEEIAAADIPVPDTHHGTLIFERNAGLFRYLLDCPAAPAQLYVVESAGRSRGYFLLTFVPGQVRIADCWVDSSEAADWRALVQLAVEQGRASAVTAAEVVLTCSDSVLEPLLASCGFHPRGTVPIWLHAGAGLPFPDVPVRFYMIDSDAAYLHDGTVQFWA